jgi:hypothetical protein
LIFLKLLSIFSTKTCRYSKIPGFNKIDCQKRMEKYAIDKKGYVALYAETQLTRKDFYDMFGFNLRSVHFLKYHGTKFYV